MARGARGDMIPGPSAPTVMDGRSDDDPRRGKGVKNNRWPVQSGLKWFRRLAGHPEPAATKEIVLGL